MIFVTGATGYTGRFVVEALCAGQFDVRCLVRKTSQVAFLERLGLSLITGDLTQPVAWMDALQGVDAVISVAHLRYAPMVIDACQKMGIRRVVFFSSTWLFSRLKTSEVTEIVAGEQAVMASGLDYTLLRPTMIYGPGDDRNISFLRKFLTRFSVMPILGGGHNLVQPVYVADVAQAVVGALMRSGAVGKAYELAGAYPMAYNEMLDVLIRQSGKWVVKVHVPLFFAMVFLTVVEKLGLKLPVRTDQIHRMREHRVFDVDVAIRELGFAPRSFQEGINEVMRIQREML